MVHALHPSALTLSTTSDGSSLGASTGLWAQKACAEWYSSSVASL